MAGKEYSDKAYQIRRQFEDLTTASKDNWQDEQAVRFGYDHAEPIRKALSDIEVPIESIIDLVNSKLSEIQRIANGK